MWIDTSRKHDWIYLIIKCINLCFVIQGLRVNSLDPFNWQVFERSFVLRSRTEPTV